MSIVRAVAQEHLAQVEVCLLEHPLDVLHHVHDLPRTHSTPHFFRVRNRPIPFSSSLASSPRAAAAASSLVAGIPRARPVVDSADSDVRVEVEIRELHLVQRILRQLETALQGLP